MTKRPASAKPALTTWAIIYLLSFVTWWTICFAGLLHGLGLWLLLPLALSLAIAWFTADRFPAVEDALEACWIITLVAHALLTLLIVADDFNKERTKDVIVCGITHDEQLGIKTSDGTYRIDDGVYNFGGKDRYVQDFDTIARAFKAHKGAKYRLTFHGWDPRYLNGAQILKGTGQCG